MTLDTIDKQIYNCNLCKDMVEKFENRRYLLSRSNKMFS